MFTYVGCINWSTIFYVLFIFYVICILLTPTSESVEKIEKSVDKKKKKEWLEREMQLLQEEYDEIPLTKQEMKEFIRNEIKQQISIFHGENNIDKE
jgi:hypothetical protein